MAFSIGRFDQFTYRYFKNDIENGTLTMDEAQEIVDAFFLKINSFYGGATQYLVHMIGANTYHHTNHRRCGPGWTRRHKPCQLHGARIHCAPQAARPDDFAAH